jgi:hypothetical protein
MRTILKKNLIMEVLIKEGDYVNFFIEFEDGDFEASATFNVLEATSWDAENKEVLETEHYLKGYIKWDGCGHIWFGDEDGYMHLCGKSNFESLKQVMDAIWEICSKKITGWNADVAS